MLQVNRDFRIHALEELLDMSLQRNGIDFAHVVGAFMTRWQGVDYIVVTLSVMDEHTAYAFAYDSFSDPEQVADYLVSDLSSLAVV